MDNILFSILVPVYNTEKYIERCIDSVMRQTYNHWELILVDDGSTDNSGIICDRYSLLDKRIKSYHKKNEGQISARQYAGNQTNGDYFIYLDSDDLLKDNALTVIYNAIQRTKSDCIIYGYERYYNNTTYGKTIEREEVTYTESKKKEFYKKVFQNHGYNSMGRKAVRADILKGLPYNEYYKIKYAEDLIQSIDVYKRCKSITVIPDILYVYVMNPNSMMNLNNKRIEAQTDYLVREKVLVFLQEENVFSEQDYSEYRNICLSSLNRQLAEISGSSFDDKKKCELFEKIRASNYYKDFLCGSDMKHMLCTLLRDRRDNELILLGKVRRKLSSVKKQVRKLSK